MVPDMDNKRCSCPSSRIKLDTEEVKPVDLESSTVLMSRVTRVGSR